MTYEAFKSEVETAVATLVTLSQFNSNGFGDGYKQIGTDISIPACECAAEITGFDLTFCKMLNSNFRNCAAHAAMAMAS